MVHGGGQARYDSRTGTSKERQVKFHWFRSLNQYLVVCINITLFSPMYFFGTFITNFSSVIVSSHKEKLAKHFQNAAAYVFPLQMHAN